MKTQHFPFTAAGMKLVLFFALFYLDGCIERPTGVKDSNLLFNEEFKDRMALVTERLTGSRYKPVFTEEFVLADVNINLNDPRRFYNYSGDLSGRYIEALSHSCENDKCLFLDSLVKKLMTFQKTDGRFGNDSLIFKEEYINHEHTALLWGNGRLLVGLLEYHRRNPDSEVLKSARRIGDFFLGICREITPEVVKRMEGLGPAGIICFTQWVEPLVMLSQATGDSRYAENAANVYPILPPRGIQHSHGYLTTLRGILLLYEYDKNPAHFNYVTQAYSELVNSGDHTIYGSVQEYFGGKGKRDEGCSTADFIRLSLHLYKLTQDISFLERAEFAVYNAFYFNQYFTGDFGCHEISNHSSDSDFMQAAWWCCTMAGLRAMQIIKEDYCVSNRDGNIKLNLFLETDYSDNQLEFSVSRGEMAEEFHFFDIRITKAENPQRPLYLRKPTWTGETKILLNGKEINPKLKEGYFLLENEIKKGDLLQVGMKYQTRVILPDKSTILLSDITKPVTGALCYGPYIMTIDNKLDYTFLSEPNNNMIYSHTVANASGVETMSNVTGNSYVGDVYLTANYKHAGFPSYYQTILRPVSEMTWHRHAFMMVSLSFAPESMLNANFAGKSMVDAWME